MQTVDELEVSYADLERLKVEPRRAFFEKLEQKRLILIIVITAIAFCVRAYHLDAAGLAEDETNKLLAARVYEQGDFTVNAEHPMLMKIVCLASLRVVNIWNDVAGNRMGFAVSEETSLRLPNVLFGALTVVPLFLLATALLGFRAGLISALLWALGLNAIWFNRVVKEDTLLVFFMLCGFYLYNKAKRQPAHDESGQEKFYGLSGAAFGLMMASKYFPHFFGLNALFYHLAGYDSRNNRPVSRRSNLILYVAMFFAFAAVNWSLFMPQTWSYISAYLGEKMLVHHGYRLGDTIYPNNMSQTPGGLPWYTYYLYLAVKLPLPVLAAFAIGLIEIFCRRKPKGSDEPEADKEIACRQGYLFLRVMLVFWLFPMSLLGAKFLRYTLSLMPILYMTAAVGIVVIWQTLSSAIEKMDLKSKFARPMAAATVIAIFVIAPSVTALSNLPHPSLYLNAIGGGRAGYFFPHDEFYDLGARESIKYIAENAPPGAIIASEIPGVVQYYLERYNRTDIRSLVLSHKDFSLAKSRPDYVLLQPGRLYFENQEHFRHIEKHYPAVYTSEYDGAIAAQVYKKLPTGEPSDVLGSINASQSSTMK